MGDKSKEIMDVDDKTPLLRSRVLSSKVTKLGATSDFPEVKS